MARIERIVSALIMITWVFPLYFFAKYLIFGWNFDFAKGLFCGGLIVALPALIAERLRERRAGKRRSEERPEKYSGPWHW